MEKKVLLKDLVDFGTHVRKQITSKVRVSDQGVYPIGEIWDANTVVDVIVNGAHDAHDTIRELDEYTHHLDNIKANKADVYTKDEIDAKIGDNMLIVDQYAIYSFISYSAETGTKWGEGRAQLTGNVSGALTEIVVLENTEPSFIGKKFFIPSDAQADGETKYTLYNSDKEDTGIEVTIIKQSDTTYRNATIKEYIDFMVGHAGGYSGQVPFDSVGTSQIINNSIQLEDLSDEVKQKLLATIDEDSENATIFG